MIDVAPPRWLKTKVSFRWGCEDVGPDEEVRVVGNCGELGNWDPAIGIRLQRNESMTTCWSSPNVSLLTGEQVEYKYAICNLTPGASVRWEWLWGNRKLIPTGLRQIIEDDDGKLREVFLKQEDEANLQSQSSFNDSLSAPGDKKHSRTSTDMSSFHGDMMPKIQSFDMRLKREKENQVTSADDVLVVFRSLPVKVERAESGWTVDAEETKHCFKVVSLLWTSLQDTEQKKLQHPVRG